MVVVSFLARRDHADAGAILRESDLVAGTSQPEHRTDWSVATMRASRLILGYCGGLKVDDGVNRSAAMSDQSTDAGSTAQDIPDHGSRCGMCRRPNRIVTRHGADS